MGHVDGFISDLEAERIANDPKSATKQQILAAMDTLNLSSARTSRLLDAVLAELKRRLIAGSWE